MFLAQPEGADPGGRGEGFGKATPLGLLLMIVLLIVVAFLVRSMTKHLKRVPKSFDPADDDPADGEQSAQAEPGESAEHDQGGREERPVETSPSDEKAT